MPLEWLDPDIQEKGIAGVLSQYSPSDKREYLFKSNTKF
jgi:hypothetical protein